MIDPSRRVLVLHGQLGARRRRHVAELMSRATLAKGSAALEGLIQASDGVL